MVQYKLTQQEGKQPWDTKPLYKREEDLKHVGKYSSEQLTSNIANSAYVFVIAIVNGLLPCQPHPPFWSFEDNRGYRESQCKGSKEDTQI
jgi:hypothetical protein